MTKERLDLGKWGEKFALKKLKGYGYKCLAKNYRCPLGEIDIIAESDEEIIFVEVKTITKTQLGTPEQKVDHNKLIKLQRAINYYLMKTEIIKDIRLDVFTVMLRKGGPRIKHFKAIGLD